MAENNNMTIFQRLTSVFSGGSPTDTPSVGKRVNSYGFNGSEPIFTTRDKAEYERKKLELRQQRLLAKQWKKANYDISNNSLVGLSETKIMYRDADLMDAFPEIGAALDVVSEEVCQTGKDGSLVNVSSKSQRIKSILEDLLVNRLSITTTLPMIARSTCKYGNTFMLLNIDAANGILGWRQMPVYEMERYESMSDNPYSKQIMSRFPDLKDNENETQFIWVGKNDFIPYRNWQMAHFRLLYDSLFLPYGCSFLNKARRHFRMLSLMEDMMLLYRLERSVERRVFKIDVGSISEEDVPSYVQQIADNFKRTPFVDQATGQLDLRKNILPVWRETPIPLLDGRTITIEQLAKEFDNGCENYVYSVQDKTHQIVPGKVVWCGKNYTAKNMIKVTLDDGGYIVLAPEHEFIMRDGSKKRADEISIGDSVMPFYAERNQTSSKYMERYEKVYNPNTGKYEHTHRLVAKEIKKPIEEGLKINTVHHKDYNKYNNNPTNLQWCNFHEHKKMHSQVAKNNWANPEKKSQTAKKISQSRIEYYKTHGVNPETNEKISNALKKKYANGEMEHVRAISRKNILKYVKSKENSENTRKNNYKRQSWKAFEAYNKSDLHKQHDEIRRLNKINFWKNGDIETAKFRMTIHFDEYIWDKIENSIFNGAVYNRESLLNFINTELINHLLEINNNKRLHNLKHISRGVLQERLKDIGFNSITEYIEHVHEELGGVNPKEIVRNKKRNNMIKFNNGGKKVFLEINNDIWNEIRLRILDKTLNSVSDITSFLNNTLLEKIKSSNNIDSDNFVIDVATITRRIKKLGFSTTTEYIESMRKNHKVSKIEYVGGDDVYCMVVMGLNMENDRHNFAVNSIYDNCEYKKLSGCFVSNCQSDDYFFPTRDPSTPSPIETLPAAQNLTALDDIKYVQNKVFTALRVPKPFLNFEENAGDGKNLSLLDVRFTRTVNRIQQMMLMELNKICIIHLYLLGFTDELTNFSLTMNNPSTQAEMLELENTSKKINTIRDAVSDPGNGIPVMSMYTAWKTILGWSEKEISENLDHLRLEVALANELEKTPEIIKNTGIFKYVDNIYGEPGAKYSDEQQQEGGEEGGMPGGGGGGGFDFGGAEDMGMPEEDMTGEEGEMGMEEGAPEEAELGGAPSPEQGAEEQPQVGENLSQREKKPLLTENRLHIVNEKALYTKPSLYDKTFIINEELNTIAKNLDRIIENDAHTEEEPKRKKRPIPKKSDKRTKQKKEA